MSNGKTGGGGKKKKKTQANMSAAQFHMWQKGGSGGSVKGYVDVTLDGKV